nr:hypothetical protein [Tanacetum cinerariifolium]
MDYLSPLGWVPTGRQNRHFPVPTDRGYSPSVISSWWKNGQLLLSPQQVVLENHIAKENPFPDAKDEGVFDSGCSKSMTGFGCWLTTTQQMVFNSPCLTDKKELIHHEGTALVVFNSPMLHFLRVGMVINSPWIMPILGTKELASPEQTAPGKEEKCGAQDAAEKIKAVTLSAAKGLSRSKAEHATAAALI